MHSDRSVLKNQPDCVRNAKTGPLYKATLLGRALARVTNSPHMQCILGKTARLRLGNNIELQTKVCYLSEKGEFKIRLVVNDDRKKSHTSRIQLPKKIENEDEKRNCRKMFKKLKTEKNENPHMWIPAGIAQNGAETAALNGSELRRERVQSSAPQRAARLHG